MAISTARKPSFCPRLWVGILQVCRRSCFCLTKLLHRSVILPLCSGTSYSPKQRSKAAAELVREILLQVMAAMCHCHQRAKNWLCVLCYSSARTSCSRGLPILFCCIRQDPALSGYIQQSPL